MNYSIEYVLKKVLAQQENRKMDKETQNKIKKDFHNVGFLDKVWRKTVNAIG